MGRLSLIISPSGNNLQVLYQQHDYSKTRIQPDNRKTTPSHRSPSSLKKSILTKYTKLSVKLSQYSNLSSYKECILTPSDCPLVKQNPNYMGIVQSLRDITPRQPPSAPFSNINNKRLTLPPELILQVFSYCAYEDYASFVQVNRIWRDCARQALLNPRKRYHFAKPASSTSTISPYQVRPSIWRQMGTHKILNHFLLRTIKRTPLVPCVRYRSDGRITPNHWVTHGIHNSPYMNDSAFYPPLDRVLVGVYQKEWYGRDYWCPDKKFLCLGSSYDAEGRQVVSVGDLLETLRQAFLQDLRELADGPYVFLKFGKPTMEYDHKNQVWRFKLRLFDKLN